MKSLLTALLFFTIIFAHARIKPERIIEIKNSGDGKTPQTAYEVFSIEEEYQLLEYFKLHPKMQMLSFIDGQNFDIFQVGKKQIYFKLILKPSA